MLACSAVKRLSHEPSPRVSVASLVCAPGELERDDRVGEALLRRVVQVAHDSSPGLVGAGNDPCPGGAQLGLRVSVRDRGAKKLGEAGKLAFDTDGEPVVVYRRHDHHSPAAHRR
jgi:hypothetical protein